MSALTTWDWLLGGIVFVSVALGLLRGLVRTAFALASWVVALVGALLGSPLLINALGVAAPVWALALPVFLILFLVTRYVGALIARGLAAVGLGARPDAGWRHRGGASGDRICHHRAGSRACRV